MRLLYFPTCVIPGKSYVTAAFLLLVALVFLAPNNAAQSTDHNSVYKRLLKKPHPGGLNEAWEYAARIAEWDLRKMRGICMFVESKEKETVFQSPFVWKWQTKFLAAAKVDVTRDSNEEIGIKVRKMWNSNEELFICNNTKFDVANGSLIKFAVNLKFDEFMIWMAKWGVNFNKVDETDDRTVLDYIRDQITSNKGLPTEPTLKHYYKMLRESGAKHKFEL